LLLVVFAVIGLLSLLLSGWLLGSQSGLRTALSLAQRFAPDTVVVDKATGRLLGPVLLSNVQVDLPGVQAQVDSVEIDWLPSQLFSGVLAIDRVKLSGLVLSLLPAKETHDAEDVAPGLELPASVEAPIDIQLTDFQVAGAQLVSGDNRIEIDNLSARFSWINSQLEVQQLIARGPLFDLETSAKVDAHDSYSSSIDARVKGRPTDYAPVDATLLIAGDVTETRLTVALGEPYNLSLAATLKELHKDPRIEATLSAASQKLSALSPRLPPVTPKLTASIAGSIDNLEFKADSQMDYAGHSYDLNLAGTGQSTGLTLDALTLDTGAGGLRGNGSVDWAENLTAAIALAGQNLDPGLYVADLPGALDLRLNVDVVQSNSGQLNANLNDLFVKGELVGLPVQATGSASLLGDTVTTKDLAVAVGDNLLTIGGNIGARSDFGWSLQLEDISQLQALARFNLAGTATGSGSFVGAIGNPRINVELRASDLVVDDQGIDTFEFVLNGRRQDHNYQMLVEAPRADVELTGRGDFQLDHRWRYELEALRVTHADPNPAAAHHEWALQESARGLVSATEFVAQPLCVQHRIPSDGGALCVSASKESAAELRATLSLEELQLANLNTLLPESVRVKGQLGGVLNWAGTLQDTRAQLDLAGVSVALEDSDGWRDAVTFLPGSISMAPVNSGDIRLAVRLPLAGADNKPAPNNPGLTTAGLFIDAQVTPIKDQPRKSWPVTASMLVEVPDMSWLSAMSDQLDPVAASLSGKLGASGKMGNPEFSGTTVLEVPKIRINELGLELLDAQLELVAIDNALELKGSMRSGEGEVALAGTVDWVDGVTVDASLRGENFMVSDLPTARATVSPDLQVQFLGDMLKLRGDVLVPLADVRLAKVPDGAISASPDQRFIEEEVAPMPLDLDASVRLRLGDDVRFTGLGLTAQFGGALTVSDQSTGATTGKGEILIKEGTYKAYGQDLSVENGKLIFAGGAIDAPGLDIRAARQATPDVLVGVQVQGSLTAPRLNVFSTPSLSQSDQLSYLVLGRPLSASSASENSILQQAAFAIGVEGGTLLTDRVGKNLGVDTFTIESEPGSGAAQAALVVGKFLSPRLYVSYGYGLFEPISTLRMEYQLNRIFRVVTQSTNEATGGDFFWVRER